MKKKCLLCLKLSKDFVNCFDVYEDECGEYHVTSLIEKHLWPVTWLKSQSQWLCSVCWQSLLEFHQFYSRIEDAQIYFDHETKSGHITTPENNLFEVDNERLVTSSDRNEINDEDSRGPIDNSKTELYSTLLQDGEEKQNHKYLDKSSDLSEEFHDESSVEMKTNFAEDLFKCHTCKKSFRNQEVFTEHTAWHKNSYVRQEFQEESSDEMKSNFVADLFQCHICEKLFRNEEVLAKHAAWHQGTGCSNLVTDLFQCHICEKLFRNQEVLEKHIAWHVGTVCSCEICDLRFFDLSTLIQHKKVHAPNKKTLKLADQEETNKSFINFSCGDFEYLEADEKQETSITPSESNFFPLACTYCSKVIVSLETMDNHIAWHKGNIQKCNLCDLKFFNEEKYEIHNLAHNMKAKYIALERGFQCKYCINIYDDKQAYLNHIAWHEDNIFYCTICDLQFLNALKFYYHKSSHDLNNTQNFVANSGGEGSQHEITQNDDNNLSQEEKPCIVTKKKKSKRGKKILKLVENKLQKNSNNFQKPSEQTEIDINDDLGINVSNSDSLQLIMVECPFCFKMLKNERVLLNHIAWHEDNVFHCTICELKFFDKTLYENHYAAHANEVEDSDDNIGSEYFICSICSKVLKTRRHFLNHNAWHVGTIYTCDICDLQFLDKTKYEDHKNTHLPKSWKRCRECGKAFACAAHVMRHWEKMHRNKFIKICDVCGKIFRCPLSFKRHTDKHQGKLKNTRIPCDICGRLLKGKQSLKSHKLINHPKDGILPYVCHICLKPTATRALLNTHITSVHGPKDSRYKCTICDKSFRNSSHLKEHSLTHSRDPNIPCQWCSKMFTRSTMLSRHRRKFHPKEYAEWKSKLYVKLPS